MSRYTAAKGVCSESEIGRFACAFLNSTNPFQGVDWDAAARDWDPNVKTASFKTTTLKAMGKATKAEGGEGGEAKKGKGGGGGGKKRKAADADDEAGDDGEEDSKPAAKKGRKAGGKGRGGKKAKADSVVDEEGVEGEGDDADKIKTEAADEEDELAF